VFTSAWSDPATSSFTAAASGISRAPATARPTEQIFENNTNLYSYGIGVINSKNMIMGSGVAGDKDTVIATRAGNAVTTFNGFTPGVIAAYLRRSS
jgi:hypothetical protein